MPKTIYQFGFRRHGNPYKGKMPIVDCTVIPNPMRRDDGLTDEQRKDKVRKYSVFTELVNEAVELLKTHDEIAIACMFGKHRSGAVAEAVAELTGAQIQYPK